MTQIPFPHEIMTLRRPSGDSQVRLSSVEFNATDGFLLSFRDAYDGLTERVFSTDDVDSVTCTEEDETIVKVRV